MSVVFAILDMVLLAIPVGLMITAGIVVHRVYRRAVWFISLVKRPRG